MTDLSFSRPKFKPFKSPLLFGDANGAASQQAASTPSTGSRPNSASEQLATGKSLHPDDRWNEEHPAKKRKVATAGEDENGAGEIQVASPDLEKASRSIGRPISSQGSQDRPLSSQNQNRRRPLLSIPNPQPSSSSSATYPVASLPNEGSTEESYFSVLFRKFTAKKHKTWDGDGVLIVQDGYALLKDDKGKDLGRATCNGPLSSESMISIGGREVEIQDPISRKDYVASVKINVSKASAKPTLRELDTQLKTVLPMSKTKASKEAVKEAKKSDKPLHAAPIQTKNTAKGFKNPQLEPSAKAPKETGTAKGFPKFDPNAPGALVMKRPSTNSQGKEIVDVVIDPLLSRHLREHQREGVKFLYECIMGMRPYAGDGAILADEMGLGKTLQVITLLWTLLKQNPIFSEPRTGVIKKALIVCPVTLIKNWRREFRKWLGRERLGVFVLDDKRSRISDFTMSRGAYNVMIVGYEKLRNIHEELQKGDGIDIVIADEGHRLKTAQNKSAQAIKSLSTTRKIILSGTPLQNDLSEFYFMVDFVNPGLLGKPGIFRREFENPIVRGRQPGASAKDIEKGQDQSEALKDLTSLFILRRTAEILSKYLPPKTEYVLMCKPTTTQLAVYKTVLQSPLFSDVLRSSEASLQLITLLKKLCNSPSLIKSTKGRSNPFVAEEGTEATNPAIASLLKSIPPGFLKTPASSGKIQVLDSFLHHVRNTTDEKVVLVSHYTSTLDILANLLDSLGFNWLRLDGSTSSAKRQENIELFNRTDAAKYFAFLMSAKAGGTGINLIGASRLVLFDIDWNPSTELQAMARIHRDGQRRHCRIYRMITGGLLDEKIWQRQLSKMSLADSVMDQKKGASAFSRDELRALFKIEQGPQCRTHEIIGCRCKALGDVPDSKAGESDLEHENMQREDSKPLLAQGLIPASQYDPDEQYHLMAKQQCEKANGDGMHALMSWTHFDVPEILRETAGSEWHDIDADESIEGANPGKTKLEDIQAALDDDVLMRIVGEKENRVSFVFAKRAGGEAIET